VGGWAEYVYVDLEMLPGTKIYELPDDMSVRLGALSEPLTCGPISSPIALERPHASSASGISRASRARNGASRSAWCRHLLTEDE
jgi:hypothetical protein